MPKIPGLSNGKPVGGNYRALPLPSCKPLVLRHHYSRRVPANIQLCYGDLDYGPPRRVLACSVFSIPASRWEVPIWELTRLVRLPEYQLPLTKLIGSALGHIRKQRLIDLIVSFADSEEDHHGGIYQACSWIYHGWRGDRLDGFNIDGVFAPARTLNSVYGTSSETELPKLLPGKVVEPHYDSGKHLYWKALTKAGMQKAISIGLGSRPYPKPMLIGGAPENYGVSEAVRKGVVNLKARDSVPTDLAPPPVLGKPVNE